MSTCQVAGTLPEPRYKENRRDLPLPQVADSLVREADKQAGVKHAEMGSHRGQRTRSQEGLPGEGKA